MPYGSQITMKGCAGVKPRTLTVKGDWQAPPPVVDDAPLQGPLAFRPGVAGVWPGVVVGPVAVPVAVPVVVPGVVLDAPPGAVTPGEAAPAPAPAEAPPAAPAAPPPAPPPPAPLPAANAQLVDMASAVAITIVVIFMTSVSLFMSKDKDCRRTTFQIGSMKLSSAAKQTAARLADAPAGLGLGCAGSGIAITAKKRPQH